MSFNEWKESELGRIPFEWEVVKIEEIADVVSGGTPSTKKLEYYGDEIAWITPKDLSGYTAKYISKGERGITQLGLENSSAKLLPPNTVLFSSRAPIGYVAISQDKVTTNQGFKNLVCDSTKVDYQFMYYKMKTLKEAFESVAGGSTFKEVSGKVVKEFNIILPTLSEQKAIANILSSLDEKIELNNQMNKTLEEMAQALFKRWFVDFEFPNEDGEPYKSSGGEMIDSELGMIPQEWEIKSLDEIADFLNGLAMQKFRPAEGEDSLPVLKIKELKQGKTDSSSDRCSKNIQDKYIIDDGDVIFSWSGSLAVGIWCGGIAGLNQHLFKVTSPTYPKWFYYMWLNEYLERFIRIAADKATTMGHIKRQHLSESKVLVPCKSLLEKMHSQFECLINKGIELKMETVTLENTRNTLLPKLMSGEIRVEE